MAVGTAASANIGAMTAGELRSRFAALHGTGTFLMPNAWDLGSARILESLGFGALATTSSGLAASLGRMDQTTTRDELVDHVAEITATVRLPVNVDAENCFPDAPGGVAATVARLAAAGASGISIEDYDPGVGVIPVEDAASRVAIVAEEAHQHGITVTVRAENHLYDIDDLDDTIERLAIFREAGGDVVYAPGLTDPADISRVVTETGAPVNVLLVPQGPTVALLADLGVRRLSTGGALAFAAYGALASAARELLDRGTSGYTSRSLSADDRRSAFE